ncbi:hypothetical protein [Bacillus thuringiensis]|uniref:Uncharacterized protein n=1 Tax=Bacillus thuringiensis TaxID=1428 RepID=A0A9X6VCB7_BACTU|nr:hypothetical protein [Bacillus thuringiensis]MEC3269872.1 hypothetical protein [Bacillus thuringiensis]PFB07938.1 hypothetical protein CN398_09395 [Bacillus thuringiensis]
MESFLNKVANYDIKLEAKSLNYEGLRNQAITWLEKTLPDAEMDSTPDYSDYPLITFELRDEPTLDFYSHQVELDVFYKIDHTKEFPINERNDIYYRIRTEISGDEVEVAYVSINNIRNAEERAVNILENFLDYMVKHHIPSFQLD